MAPPTTEGETYDLVVREVRPLGGETVDLAAQAGRWAGIGSGLVGLIILLALREEYRDRLTMQLVAFPQSGVLTAPGMVELLGAAVREGADLVGGLDPIGFDGDLDGQLDAIFGLADRYGVGLDIHLHDAAEVGAQTLEAISGRAEPDTPDMAHRLTSPSPQPPPIALGVEGGAHLHPESPGDLRGAVVS